MSRAGHITGVSSIEMNTGFSWREKRRIACKTWACEFDNSDTGYRPCKNSAPAVDSSLIIIRMSQYNNVTIQCCQQLNTIKSNNLVTGSSYLEKKHRSKML